MKQSGQIESKTAGGFRPSSEGLCDRSAAEYQSLALAVLALTDHILRRGAEGLDSERMHPCKVNLSLTGNLAQHIARQTAKAGCNGLLLLAVAR